jgi:histidinol phosphatase-like enzyme
LTQQILDMSQKSAVGDRFSDLQLSNCLSGSAFRHNLIKTETFQPRGISTATIMIKHFSLLIVPLLVYIRLGETPLA